MTPVDPRMIHLFSYYRDAELRGASLLLKLIMRVDDPETQTKLSLHLADETRHVWLWTKHIADLGCTPVPIDDGYQTRIGRSVGIPRAWLTCLPSRLSWKSGRNGAISHMPSGRMSIRKPCTSSTK